jgi:wyosine [tRNA(Phe)-imidazoG37] synthetase (radical SAM superfamily)
MKTVYGPIPSRRLGQSLGIDPIPLKTCNWNCIYCQLGRTRPLTNTRRVYVPVATVISEVAGVLRAVKPGAIDFISFVGSGEPTLNSALGEMIRQVKAMTAIPVAVITNGSLLHRAEVRRDLSAADVVMPTLVAGRAELYRKISRPHPEVTFSRFVEGLRSFRQDYAGKLWVEVMLIHEVNDTPQALDEMRAILAHVEPDEIHITLPTRPPSETWVTAPDDAGAARAARVFGAVARVVPPDTGQYHLMGAETEAAEMESAAARNGRCAELPSELDAVLAVIKRHPMNRRQLEQALKPLSGAKLARRLRELEETDCVRMVERLGERFWVAHDALFPDEEQSARTDLFHRTDTEACVR